VRAAAWLAALSLLLPLAGCGYALVGRNTFLPERIKVIVVTPFENRTARPQIEQRVTEEVARELSKRGRYKIVTEKAEADALLEGAVADFRTNPVQFNAQGRATRVETVVTIQATLRDLQGDAILWSQSGLLFREQYDVPANETSYFDQENQALDEIAQGAASALVTSVLEGF
jgi:outer membrane lipopolysaccharide assembly protein LptE/RlpB